MSILEALELLQQTDMSGWTVVMFREEHQTEGEGQIRGVILGIPELLEGVVTQFEYDEDEAVEFFGKDISKLN